MFKKPYRKRDIQVAFRCTKEEAAIIDQKVRTTGMSRTEYLLSVLKNKEIQVYPGLLSVMSELKRQGINLNQALRYTHNDPGFSKELREAIRNCNNLYCQCLQLWIKITTDPDYGEKIRGGQEAHTSEGVDGHEIHIRESGE